jgi:hypothetical protein
MIGGLLRPDRLIARPNASCNRDFSVHASFGPSKQLERLLPPNGIQFHDATGLEIACVVRVPPIIIDNMEVRQHGKLTL